MAFGTSIFNPGDLTVGNSNTGLIGNGMLYPGQSGVVSGPTLSDGSNFFFAQFPNAQIGSAALIDYVTRHIAKGWNTLATFVYGFLGTSSNNAANPHVAGYLQAVEQATGLGPNSTITAADAPAIAAGISKAEGTTGFTMGTQAQNSLGGALSSLVNDFNTGVNYIGQNGVAAGASIFGQTAAQGSLFAAQNPAAALGMLTGSFNTGASTVTKAASDTTAQAINSVGKQIAGIGSAITGLQNFGNSLFSPSNLERGVLIVVGILLLAAAVFTLSKSYVPSVVAAAT